MDQQVKWRTIGFVAAPPGWRAAYGSDTNGPTYRPIAGWLLQEQLEVTTYNRKQQWHDPDDSLRPETRVIAGHADEFGYVEPVAETDNLIDILAPGEEDLKFDSDGVRTE